MKLKSVKPPKFKTILVTLPTWLLDVLNEHDRAADKGEIITHYAEVGLRIFHRRNKSKQRKQCNV